jgi:excisionase family DNA binding protein
MSEPDTKQAAGGKGEANLLTLSEVSKRTKISMPTLQRYKKEFQSRIPSVGKGRRQRYPKEALAVFEEIKKENIGRRGRPRKNAAAPARRGRKPKAAVAAAPARRGRKPKAAAVAAPARRGRPRKVAAAPSGGTGGLLTLTEISKRTGISYPTLVRYVKLHLRQMPHEGSGRRRRFHPEAVEVFNRLRSESGRGRKPGRKPAAVGRPRAAAAVRGGGDGDLTRRVKSLEKSQASLEKQIQNLIKQLQKPMTVTMTRGR